MDYEFINFSMQLVIKTISLIRSVNQLKSKHAHEIWPNFSDRLLITERYCYKNISNLKCY